MRLTWFFAVTVAAISLLAGRAGYSADVWGLKSGAVELKSGGPMTFGPEGILLVGDTTAATVYAIATDDASGDPAKVKLNIPKLQEKVAEVVGSSAERVRINDLAVNPRSGNVYLSVSSGEPRQTGIVRIDAAGKIGKLSLKEVKHSKAVLANAPESKEGGRRGNPRDQSITDLAYVEGKVIVSGLAGGEAPSMVRELVFPFAETDLGTSIEIYHGAHGRLENNAVVRTFIPFTIDGEPTLLAGFTCTPLVKFPLDSLKPGQKVRGTTVAELGNRNQPLDMIVYKKDGKSFLLMSNNNRGVMKISTDNIRENAGITKPVRGGGTAGQPYETIKELAGVEQMDRLNDEHAIVLVKAEGGALDLKTVELP
jgi:hypothetical protein